MLFRSLTLSKANDDIRKYIYNSQISYVTAFYAALNVETKQLTYSKAGHVPALLMHENGEVDELSAKGVFLGMYEKETYEEKQCQLASGDRLILYTDGITETKNSKGEDFGLDRFKDFISKNRQVDVDELIDKIFKKVNDFSDRKDAKDDQTVIILEIE